MNKRKHPRASKPKGFAPSRKTRVTPPAGIWLYGLHAVLAALANPARRNQRLFLTREAQRLIEKKKSQSNPLQEISVEIVPREAIATSLPKGAVHQGCALLTAPLEPVSLEMVLRNTKEKTEALVVLLDQVTDPQNVGAVLRSAAAFGADAVLLTQRHSPNVSGAVAKAASGALEKMPLVQVTNLARSLETLKEAGFWCIGLDPDAETPLPDIQTEGRTALVLGAEGTGLRRLTQAHCDFLARLPIHSKAVASLNVSAAAAVALYELAGRRALALSSPTGTPD